MQVIRAVYPLLDRDIATIATHQSPCGPVLERTEIPIEGVGVTGVITEVPDDDPRYAFTDVLLARYRDGQLTAPVPIAGSVCESPVARCMHEHWCDLERLIRCVQGDTNTLCVLDIDWEIGDEDDESDQSSDEASGVDPGLTPRILEIYQRAEERPVAR
ncbi:hypothetical protein BA059_16045 [Mycolicibacterium sp. (ex Dasyatis americana)]|nr:hypothetical protein BA059_16045 [Mycolicibacterium sp. (ex Dasyatis americana)]